MALVQLAETSWEIRIVPIGTSQLGRTSWEISNARFVQSARLLREASIPAFQEINILVYKDDPFVLGSFEADLQLVRSTRAVFDQDDSVRRAWLQTRPLAGFPLHWHRFSPQGAYHQP